MIYHTELHITVNSPVCKFRKITEYLIIIVLICLWDIKFVSIILERVYQSSMWIGTHIKSVH